MRTLILIGIILFSANGLFAQSDGNVKEIRDTVEQINKDTGYTTKTLDNMQFLEQMTDGGGQLTGYFKNGQLVKIVERVWLSSCVATYDYYLQNNLLIFIYGQENDFKFVDSAVAFNYDSLTLAMECRYYFNNDQLIKTEFKGTTRCSQQPSENDAKDLMAECKRYIVLLKDKKI
jgi:hypothetical protein